MKKIIIAIYNEAMQSDIEDFFTICFEKLGWGFNPEGSHSDIVSIPESYIQNGQFWCVYDNGKLIGTVAVRTIDKVERIAELKRLYVLPDRQGEGFGGMLFETALQYAKEKCFKKICADTRCDRSASRHLMEKHGFVEVPKYNDNAFAELFYELNLIK